MIEVVKYPDPVLLTPCATVTEFGEELHKILDQMPEIMKAQNGIGLAANQIGISKRFFVMLDNKEKLWEFVNPEIIDRDGHLAINEGCLSAPGVFVQVPRSETVTIKAQNRLGEEFKIVCTGIEAICAQHEIEHLQGEFFLEKTSRNQRRAALRALGLK